MTAWLVADRAFVQRAPYAPRERQAQLLWIDPHSGHVRVMVRLIDGDNRDCR
jgi:hypothetical protein